MARDIIPPPVRSAPVPARVGQDAADYAARRGGVRRILASNDGAGLLYASGLPPERFTHDDGLVWVSPVLIECRDGTWFALDRDVVNVGYSGAGPGEAIAQLALLGVEQLTAEQIAHAGYSDVLLDAAGKVEGAPVHLDRPPQGLATPTFMNDEWAATLYLEGTQFEGGEADHARRWAAFLDAPDAEVPAWVSGRRSSIVFLDRQFAASAGLVAPAGTSRFAQPIAAVIRQGRMALWIVCPEPLDGTRNLHPVMYDLLEVFGFELPQLRAQDHGSVWARRLRRLLPGRPAMVVPHRSAALRALGHR